MLARIASHRRRFAQLAAALVLGMSAAHSASAQPPIPTGGAQSYREPGPITPEISEAGGGQTRTNTGQATSNPVFTPGYFEVVCPAICYGGAFHVFGNRAYGGAGYYGPFRRYWAYSTYGPNFNIGPDNSLQFGLKGGVMYLTERKCKGLCKHGSDCRACGIGRNGGSVAGMYGAAAQLNLLAGSSQQPAENAPPPAPNTARLQLQVPENAEILVEGSKTTTTGPIREFITPPLPAGITMLYAVTVRYADASGQPIEESRTVRVRANDQLRIDCTQQPAAQAKVDSQPSAAVQRP